MFDVYFDDSGTSPAQRIAVAAALVVPRSKTSTLKNEWNSFCDKYGITDFHTSVCVYKNRKSQFAGWDDEKVNRAIQRVQQITKKYAIRAISYGVAKRDFDEEVPEQWREFVDKDHYAWAVRHVLSIIQRWTSQSGNGFQFEYFFDSQTGNTKKAIKKVMNDEELLAPGRYEGHYSFGERKKVPGLQCVDLLAWACLGAARLTFENTPIHRLAESTIRSYANHRIGGWLLGGTNTREHLHASIRKYLTALPARC